MTVAPADTHLKTTPLYDWHVANGGKMTSFGGWDMPLQYQRVHTEHAAVRNDAGLFDVSHMGLVSFSGPNDETLLTALEALVPQHLTPIQTGHAVYTQLLNESGGIVDDCIVYRRPQAVPIGFANIGPWFVVLNAGNLSSDLDWLTNHLPASIAVTYHSELSLFALQGPKFKHIISRLGITTLPERFTTDFCAVSVHGKTATIGLSRTGYTGEDGVEIIVPNEFAEILWEGLLHAGEPDGLVPVGLAARDTLRTEAAYPLHGQDISPSITPLQAGLGWSLRLDKPFDFIGKDALITEKAEGPSKKTICLTLSGKAIARPHTPVLSQNGEVIGEVTSGTLSPTLNVPIAMALVDANNAPEIDQTCLIDIRGKQHPATRVKRPFYSGL